MTDSHPGDDRTGAELTEAAHSGLRWVTYTRIALEVLMLAAMVVLARLIPPAAFGIFAVVMIVQELAVGLPSEGIGCALVQRRSIRQDHLRTGLTLSLLMGCALAALTATVAFALVDPVFGDETQDLVLLAIPCCLLGALNVVPLALLRRQLAFSRVAAIELSSTVARLLATISLALVGLDAAALVLGFLAGSAVAVVLGYLSVHVPSPGWRAEAARDLLPYGGPAALAAVSWAGFRNGDYAIVNAQLGAAQAGFYWRSYQVSVEYQKKIGVIMAQIAFPVLARTARDEDMLALRHRMARGLTVVLFPMLALLVVLAPVAIPWLFGPTWEPAVLPAQILAAGGAATLVIDCIAPALMASGRSKAILGFGVAHFAVYIGAVLMFAYYGLAAVALVAAVVHGIFVIVAYQVLLRSPRAVLRALLNDVAPAVAGCLPLVAVAILADRWLSSLGTAVVVHLAVVSAIGAVAYLATLRVCSREAWADLNAVMRRLLPQRMVSMRRFDGPRNILEPSAGSVGDRTRI